jgi:hypothetical protein
MMAWIWFPTLFTIIARTSEADWHSQPFLLLNRFLECDQYGVQKIQKHDMPFMFKR